MSDPAKPRILLGLTGGIACYKSCRLVRLLSSWGADVRVVMTRHAEQFVGPLTFSTLSGNPVYADPFNGGVVHGAEHVDLSIWADLAIVAPASANILGKVANGIADDFLSTLLCAYDKTILFAPAMNKRMWANPAVQRNLAQVQHDGARIVSPTSGWLACGETGDGRMAEPEEIFEHARALLMAGDELRGRRVLISAGPTHEDIDEVRFLSNRSTGKMGFALARVAQWMGADTVLVAGPSTQETPVGVTRINVRSAAQMAEAVLQQARGADLIIMAAAVADYTPSVYHAGKLSKSEGPMCLELSRTIDILAALAKDKGERVHVGFAVQVENGVELALDKLRRKHLDIICLNNPREEGAGFACDTNRLTLLSVDGVREDLDLMSKEDAATRVLQRAALLLNAPAHTGVAE